MKYNLSEIMKTAWQFVKVNGFTMSEALKQAWLNIKLKVKMFKGVVHFWYQKVSGEIREAWGTLNERFLPTGEGSGNNHNVTCQNYWDTEAENGQGAWRRYKIANLMKVA